MKPWASWFVGFLVLGLGVWGHAAPTMEDHYLFTFQNEAVVFEVRATDDNIDPAMPDAYPLVFSLVDGPSHGVLLGDLGNVAYRDPHLAVVELTYIPADGYVGSDFILVAVTDELGQDALGTTTIEIEVGARRSSGLLSGNWTTTTTYNTQTGGFTAFRTQFTEVYRVGNLSFKGIAAIRMDVQSGAKEMVFDSLRFETEASIAGIRHTSVVAFDPKETGIDLFDSWQATTRFSVAGVDFTHTLSLQDVMADSYQALSASARLGDWSVSNSLRFDADAGCGFSFSRNDTSVSWAWCDTAMRGAVGFTCDGFEYLTIGAGGIPIPALGFIPGGVSLDTAVTFTLDGKSMTADLNWRPGAASCIQILAQLRLSGPGSGPVSGDTVLEGIDIYGLKVTCDIPGDYGPIRFVSATSLSAAFNSRVTGQSDYFEVIRLSGPLLSCCGVPGSWGVATYFHVNSTMLFDWGMTLIRADVAMTDYFNFVLETVFRSGFFGDPKLELTVGWTTRW